MPRGKRLNVTDEELREMRAEGLSDYKIAKIVGCCATTISNRIGKRSAVEVKTEEKVAELKKLNRGRRLPFTNEELMRMRKSGMTDAAIAKKMGCSPTTVVGRIGKRPAAEVKAERKERLKKANAARAAKRAEKEPKIVEKEPEIVVKPSEPIVVEPVAPPTAPTPEKIAEMIPTDLFALAFIPVWYEQLHDLAEMAQNESWRFKREYPNKNLETPILGAYINRVYRRLAIPRNATPPGEDNECIFIRGQVLCFHTGLYTPLYKGIYALFRPNPRPSVQKWYFEGFFDEISGRLRGVHPLPKPLSELEPRPNLYDPHKPIRVNITHMIETAENLGRLPESIRDAWNLPLLLETAVELSRRKTCIEPGIVLRTRAPQSDAYAMPLWLTNMDKPDAAVLLEDMGDYYAARTNLTLEQAYLDARQNGRPTAKWLTDLVE